jgi:large subunit ribosomal protein L9
MDVIAKQIEGLVIAFPARASETGKLYGSITAQMIVEAIKAKKGVDVARRQIDAQPLRMLGEYKVHVRLTVDMIPEIKVIVHREGEIIAMPAKAEEQTEAAAEA